MFKLGSDIDWPEARRRLDRETRCQIAGLLDEADYDALQDALARIPRWVLVTRLGGRHLDLDAEAMFNLPAAKRMEFERQVRRDAEHGFQYLYETYPLYDKWHNGSLRPEAPMLADLFEWLNSPGFLDPMREALGAPDIRFADAQLTRYRTGHVLNTHDDGVEGKNRVAAYVLTLSPEWREAWGGTLSFMDDTGREVDRFVPARNTLSVFKVPQKHQVLPVARKVKAPRLSITGWLRRGSDPGP